MMEQVTAFRFSCVAEVVPCFCLLVHVNMKSWTPYHIKENYSYHSLRLQDTMRGRDLRTTLQKCFLLATVMQVKLQLVMLFFSEFYEVSQHYKNRYGHTCTLHGRRDIEGIYTSNFCRKLFKVAHVHL